MIMKIDYVTRQRFKWVTIKKKLSIINLTFF